MPVAPMIAQAGGTGRNTPFQRATALLEVEQLVSDGVLGSDLLTGFRTGPSIIRSRPGNGPGQQCRLPDGALTQFLTDDVDGLPLSSQELPFLKKMRKRYKMALAILYPSTIM